MSPLNLPPRISLPPRNSLLDLFDSTSSSPNCSETIKVKTDIIISNSLFFLDSNTYDMNLSNRFKRSIPTTPSSPLKSRRTLDYPIPSFPSSSRSIILSSEKSPETSNSLYPLSPQISPQRDFSSKSDSTSSDSLIIDREETITALNYNGFNFKISPITYLNREGKVKFAKGYHSMAYAIDPDQDRLFPDIDNHSLIVKKPLEEALSRFGNSLKNFFTNPLTQYKICIKNEISIAEILNTDTCHNDGFIIQKKVKAFTEAPWSKSESLEEIEQDSTKSSYLKQIIDLCVFNLLYMEDMGMDLKWDNLGLSLNKDFEEDSELILFDFKEERDEFYLFLNYSIIDLSNSNPAIASEILRQILIKLDSYVATEEIIRDEEGYFFKDSKKLVIYNLTLESIQEIIQNMVSSS